MRPTVVTLTATGTSSPVVLDYLVSPFNIGLFVDTTATTNVATVQYSFDDPWASYATDYNTNATWVNHPTMTAVSVDTDGNIAYPCRAVRLTATNITASQSVKLTVIQAGPT